MSDPAQPGQLQLSLCYWHASSAGPIARHIAYSDPRPPPDITMPISYHFASFLLPAFF
jgi:hypothetical protein